MHQGPRFVPANGEVSLAMPNRAAYARVAATLRIPQRPLGTNGRTVVGSDHVWFDHLNPVRRPTIRSLMNLRLKNLPDAPYGSQSPCPIRLMTPVPAP